MKFFLAIDQGTHASRACLFDETGELVCSHTKDIRLSRHSSSEIEQDANEIVNSAKQVIAKVLHEAGTPDAIAACGIATQRSSVVAWSNDGMAISPVLSWQDTRGRQQLEHLKKHKPEIQQLSGLPLSAHYGATKLRYLLEMANRQNVTVDTLRLSPVISYLLFHLLESSPYIVDHSNAQRTQLFELSAMNWSPRLMQLFNLPLQVLPECVPVVTPAASPHGKLAGTEIPICAINGDQNAAIYGAGSLTADTALVNFGTGAFVLRMLPHYQSSDKQLTGIACSSHNTVEYVREATINGGASALSWLETRYRVSNVLNRLPLWLDTVRHPPVFINTIGGLGSPWWRSDIEAVFIPHNATANKQEELAKKAVAVIESIVFMVCLNLEIIHKEQAVCRLYVSGGLSQLDGLCQRLASLSGLTVERSNVAETTARGVAWLAAGKPQDWSVIKPDIFKPVHDQLLTERYSLFTATLNHLSSTE